MIYITLFLWFSVQYVDIKCRSHCQLDNWTAVLLWMIKGNILRGSQYSTYTYVGITDIANIFQSSLISISLNLYIHKCRNVHNTAYFHKFTKNKKIWHKNANTSWRQHFFFIFFSFFCNFPYPSILNCHQGLTGLLARERKYFCNFPYPSIILNYHHAKEKP